MQIPYIIWLKVFFFIGTREILLRERFERCVNETKKKINVAIEYNMTKFKHMICVMNDTHRDSTLMKRAAILMAHWNKYWLFTIHSIWTRTQNSLEWLRNWIDRLYYSLIIIFLSEWTWKRGKKSKHFKNTHDANVFMSHTVFQTNKKKTTHKIQ